MWALYILISGLFWFGGNIDDAPKSFIGNIGFILRCFLEGWILAPAALGAALIKCLQKNDI